MPRRAAGDHLQLHRGQVLRLVHDHVPEALRRLGQERAGLVDERQVGLAPPAARSAEERLLVGVEDPFGGFREALPRGEQAAHDLLGLRRRPDVLEEARHPPVATQRALDLGEVAVRLAAEPGAVVLVEAAQRRSSGSALARPP